ncbi:MAG: hypothetical protein ACREAO_02190 [Nitrososphaera sp.]
MAEAEQEIHAYSDARLEKMHGNDGKSYEELLKYVKRYGMHRHFDISY